MDRKVNPNILSSVPTYFEKSNYVLEDKHIGRGYYYDEVLKTREF